MTISRIYAANGNHANFWVQHRKWGNVCGRVVTIAGQESGALPSLETVDESEIEISTFDIRSGRPVELAGDVRRPQDAHYKVIAEPNWFRRSAPVARRSPVYTLR